MRRPAGVASGIRRIDKILRDLENRLGHASSAVVLLPMRGVEILDELEPVLRDLRVQLRQRCGDIRSIVENVAAPRHLRE